VVLSYDAYGICYASSDDICCTYFEYEFAAESQPHIIAGAIRFYELNRILE